MSLVDRFEGGISLAAIVGIVTLVSVLWIGMVSLNKMENQLLVWMKDAEIERQDNQEKIAKYHSDILVMIGGLNDINGRVHNLEQYNLKRDPDYELPLRRY